MKRIFRILGLLLLVALVGMQFIPVDRTNPTVNPDKDMLNMLAPDVKTASLIKTACYDCHSHETEYPWYSKVAPVSLLLQDHIKEGREHLNFSTWGDYPAKKAAHKLEECYEETEHGEMPLKGYTLFNHKGKSITD